MTPDQWNLVQLDLVNGFGPIWYLWLVSLLVGAMLMSVLYTVLSTVRSALGRWK